MLVFSLDSENFAIFANNFKNAKEYALGPFFYIFNEIQLVVFSIEAHVTEDVDHESAGALVPAFSFPLPMTNGTIVFLSRSSTFKTSAFETVSSSNFMEVRGFFYLGVKNRENHKGIIRIL